MKNHIQLCTALIFVFSLVSGMAGAQTHAKPHASKAAPAAKSEHGKFKAIWEPVNYKEDLNFNDVHFADEQNGWVTGEHGTILRTKDGGDTWTPQIGGDPEAKDEWIHDLRFVDSTHGWAAQGTGDHNKLLRTTDGENWEQIGTLGGNYGYGMDYFFTSPTVGFQLRTQPTDIARTMDAGKTWKEVMKECETKMEINGLTKHVGCKLTSLHFPSQNVGYAIGTGEGALFVAKTEDGGASWRISFTPEVASSNSTYFRQEVFFTSESDGVVAMNDGKIFATSDGGNTWHGVIGSARSKVKFAGPHVGWSFNDSQLSYTTNGGKSWTTREFRFPEKVKAFSLPSRQRAYVIGNHGMIYRYRVVPESYTAKGMFDAPMMPGE